MSKVFGRLLWGLVGLAAGAFLARGMNTNLAGLRGGARRGRNRRTTAQRMMRVAAKTGGDTLSRTLRAMRS